MNNQEIDEFYSLINNAEQQDKVHLVETISKPITVELSEVTDQDISKYYKTIEEDEPVDTGPKLPYTFILLTKDVMLSDKSSSSLLSDYIFPPNSYLIVLKKT